MCPVQASGEGSAGCCEAGGSQMGVLNRGERMDRGTSVYVHTYRDEVEVSMPTHSD